MPELANIEVRVAAEVHRKDFWIRMIIVAKLVKATLLATLGVTAFVLAHRDVNAAMTSIVTWFGLNPGGPRVERFIAHVTGMTPHRIEEVGVGAFVIAGVMLTEAWGLHRRRVWAEWFTIGITTSLIPLEIYELAIGASMGKVVTLVLNVAIVIYLASHRGLFTHGRLGRWLQARRRPT